MTIDSVPPGWWKKPNTTRPREVMTFPYSTTQILTEAAGGLGVLYTFKTNDVFDPDFTGTGQQPIGFDEFSQLYGRTRVIAFRWEVDFANMVNAPIRVGVFASPQSTISATPAAWPVAPYLGAQCKTVSAFAGGGDVARLSGTVNLPDMFGVTKREFLDDSDFSATTSTSPSRKGYLHVWAVGLTTAAVLRIYPRLYYLTELSQTVAISLS